MRLLARPFSFDTCPSSVPVPSSLDGLSTCEGSVAMTPCKTRSYEPAMIWICDCAISAGTCTIFLLFPAGAPLACVSGLALPFRHVLCLVWIGSVVVVLCCIHSTSTPNFFPSKQKEQGPLFVRARATVRFCVVICG